MSKKWNNLAKRQIQSWKKAQNLSIKLIPILICKLALKMSDLYIKKFIYYWRNCKYAEMKIDI